MKQLISTNPYTQLQIAAYKAHSTEQLESICNNTFKAYQQWRHTNVQQRSELLERIADALQQNAKELAEMATLEMGKPITQSYKEVDKCVFVCRYYANRLEEFLRTNTIESSAHHSYVAYQPLGVVLAIMPWNFPYWQVFRSMVPIIAGGNAYILKHAPNVTGCALLIMKVLEQALVPQNLVNLLLLQNEEVQTAIENKNIAAVTFTGSTKAGSIVARTAGSVLKKCVLELGGNDASIFMQDAPIQSSVEAAVFSRLINNGQSCIAAKRFIVPKSKADEYITAIQQQLNKVVIGDPMNKETELGPLARIDLAQNLNAQIQESVQQGAHLITCGKIDEAHPYYIAPSILTNIKSTMPAYTQELFGPVISLLMAESDEHAIELANDSIYGLGAAIYSANTKQAEILARTNLEAGNCFVNDFVRSVPGMPFGGIKQSGYGRELGVQGMYEFMNIKTVYVR